MEAWLVSFDAVLDTPPSPDMAMEVLEGLSLGQSYCDMQRIGLDDSLRRVLTRARTESMSGRQAGAEQALARAEQRLSELDDPDELGLGRGELDLARVEVAMRTHRDGDARVAYARADASTTQLQESRAELKLAWARYLALEGSQTERHRAENLYYEGMGLLGVKPSRGRAALLFETQGQVARGLGRLDEAVRAFEQAGTLYQQLDCPMLSIRARQNAAAVVHEQGDLVLARRMYEQMLEQVADSDRSDAVSNARYELAIVLREQLEATPELACEQALAQLELVVAHARPQLRAEALGRGAQIIGELGCVDRLPPWVSRADAAVNDVQVSDVRARIEVQVALALLFAGDPRGEPRVLALLRRADLRETDWFKPLLGTWLAWLTEHARCDEMRVWIADPDVPSDFVFEDCPPPRESTPP